MFVNLTEMFAALHVVILRVVPVPQCSISPTRKRACAMRGDSRDGKRVAGAIHEGRGDEAVGRDSRPQGGHHDADLHCAR